MLPYPLPAVASLLLCALIAAPATPSAVETRAKVLPAQTEDTVVAGSALVRGETVLARTDTFTLFTPPSDGLRAVATMVSSTVLGPTEILRTELVIAYQEVFSRDSFAVTSSTLAPLRSVSPDGGLLDRVEF